MAIVKVRKTGGSLSVSLPSRLNDALKDRFAEGSYAEVTVTTRATFEIRKVTLPKKARR